MKDFNEKWYVIGSITGIFAGIGISFILKICEIWNF